ncbi:hypothetical protein IQ259_17180 [Fortiea sp. LEGE XX443]|uniref:hypothetical protein n=1 Tax=Fortiea sp. LEGE XX443 TaxID=1828611 RepID=UPI00187F19FE|nr:hypothetical protein [Fortiea sp. LEGE XX443]MBE9006749.1 hypothetical protein [Fortiea sp. LEGE XX443]
MTSNIKLSAIINNTSKLPRGVVLTLALTSLLSFGQGFASNYAADAAPRGEPIQLSQRLPDHFRNRANRLPRGIADTIIRDAARRARVPNNQVRITQATRKTFGNPCIFNFGEVCTREYNPIQGWEVVVRVQNQSWIYHTNESGSQIVLDPNIGDSGSGINSQLPRAIANNILRDASRRSGVNTNNLRITQATRKTFSNTCVFNFGEVCTQQYDPISGWEVIVRVERQLWTYHSNESGSQIVLDPNISDSGSGSNNQLPRAIANNILRDAARRSGEDVSDLRITEATRKTFSNRCVFNFGEVCTREYNPIQGWEVVVRVQNQSWTYHSNESGSQIVLDPQFSDSGSENSYQLPRAIANNILRDAARRSDEDVSDLRITEATRKTFSNRCVFNFGEICTREYNPIQGWEVIVRVRRQSWTYHANESGSQIVLDPEIGR